jgi:methylglyoxal synthase
MELAIGMVAHDRSKRDLATWLVAQQRVLAAWTIYATGTTASVLKACGTSIRITGLRSGPFGGDQQLGGMIAERKLHALVFFTDPMTPMPHDVDIRALLRLSTLYNIPVAVNRATADLMVANQNFERFCGAERNVPAESEYISRQF